MNDADFVKALQSAKREMTDLLEKRSNIDRRITQLKDTVDTLTALLLLKGPSLSEAATEIHFEKGMAKGGVTDAIRNVLATSGMPMTPPQVRNALFTNGVDLRGYANSLSVIHNTLKRLERQGELMAVRGPTGKRVAYTTRCEPPTSIDIR